jgi:uncharacterized protein YcgL (UPF0745 family)
MLCFIYKSLKKDGLYLYLDKKEDFSALPETLLANVGKLAFVMELELTPERKLAREDSQKVLASLKEKGFFMQLPPLVLSELPRLS